MRIISLVFPIFVVANLSSSLAIAADDVAACIASDHYHNLDTDYVICDRALKQPNLSDETKANLLVGRGEILYFSNRMELALRDLDDGLKLKPDHHDGHLRRAWTEMHLGEYQPALDDINVLLTKDPDDVDALFAYGFLHVGTKEANTKTIPIYTRILELNPNHLLTRYNFAPYHKLEIAIAEYERVLTASDEEFFKVKMFPPPSKYVLDFKSEVNWALAIKLGAGGQNSKELPILNKLADSYPEVGRIFSERSLVYRDLGRWPEELADAKRASKLNPQDGDAIFNQISGHIALKQFEEGLNLANSEIDKPHTSICGCLGNEDILFERAILNEKLNHNEQALKDYERSIELQPKYLGAILTALIQEKYYVGQTTDPYSDAVRNSLKACIIDPECTA